MKIENMRINGIKNPVGFDYYKIICSWLVKETKSKTQSHVQITVSDREDFSTYLYKKEGAKLKQSGEVLEMNLTPRTRYYYRIEVTGDYGDRASGQAYFETGKMKEPWQARWIAMEKTEKIHPVFTKRFQVDKGVKSARLYITGVGLFEAVLNGKKVGNEFLTPYISDYQTDIQIMTFPLDNLRQDENELNVFLGKGWYMGVFGLEQEKENFGNRMALIAELHICYKDGKEDIICTDDTWEYQGADIEDSGIYFGEIYNRLLWTDKVNEKHRAVILDSSGYTPGIQNLQMSHLTDRYSLPVIVKEEVKVKEVIRTPAGESVLDMGQNFAGFMEMKLNQPRGTRIILDFGEILQSGNFYNGNYREAKSQFVYVSDGHAEVVRAHFTFFGFRYVRVKGYIGDLNPQDFTGKVLYSDLTRTGYIETSDVKLNRLYENTLWGMKSNFLDIPTDCPQRGERLGWTGDTQVFSRTACYHMDTRAFYHKFIRNLQDEQKKLDGGVPNYFPNIGIKKDVGSVWGDSAAILPEQLYEFYGDKTELEYDYPLMKGWVDYITRKDIERGQKYLFDFGFHFGDWLALDGPTQSSYTGSTDAGFIGTVYYYNSTKILAKSAKQLGKSQEEKAYEELASRIKGALYKEYFSSTGRLAVDTQTAYLIALKFGVYPNREKLIEGLKRRLELDCHEIKGGFVGAPMICSVLAENGLTELAYDFLLKEDFPGWLYSVNLGATTIWERWNSVLEDGTVNDAGMNSLNHYAYGAVVEFLYAYAAGIRQVRPGFREVQIAPQIDNRLNYVKCRYDSVNGTYVSEWERMENGEIELHIEVPFQCKAHVIFPGKVKVADDNAGMGDEKILGPGTYMFRYYPQYDIRKPYSKDTTLGRLAKDEEAMGILFQYVPVIGGMASSGDKERAAQSLGYLRSLDYLPNNPEKFDMAIEEISQLIR